MHLLCLWAHAAATPLQTFQGAGVQCPHATTKVSKKSRCLWPHILCLHTTTQCTHGFGGSVHLGLGLLLGQGVVKQQSGSLADRGCTQKKKKKYIRGLISPYLYYFIAYVVISLNYISNTCPSASVVMISTLRVI